MIKLIAEHVERVHQMKAGFINVKQEMEKAFQNYDAKMFHLTEIRIRFWDEISKLYGIDLQNENWKIIENETGSYLVSATEEAKNQEKEKPSAPVN